MAESPRRISNFDKARKKSSFNNHDDSERVRESVFQSRARGSLKSPRISYAITRSIVRPPIDETREDDEEEFRLTGIQQNLEISEGLNIVSQVDGTRNVLCLSYTETCDFIAAGLSDGTIRMIKVATGEYNSSLRDSETHQNPGSTTSIKHRPVHKSHPITQSLLATYDTGCVKSWHYPTGQCLYTIRENRRTLGLAYHPHLPKFVTVGDDANLCLYDDETKTQERVFHASDAPDVASGHRSRVFCACFNPKSLHEIISSGEDETVQFWDTRQPYALRHIGGVGIRGEGLDISKNGKEILTCSWTKKNALQLWDYGSGKLIVTLDPDSRSSQLYTGKFVDSLFVACGGCDSNLFRIVDLRSHSTLASVGNLPGGVYSLDVGPLPLKRSKRTRLSELPQLPKIAFCCGKTIFEVDVG